MATTKAGQRAVARYVTANYDDIKIRPPKGAREVWKAAADAAGVSLNQFVINAVEMAMEAQKEKAPA